MDAGIFPIRGARGGPLDDGIALRGLSCRRGLRPTAQLSFDICPFPFSEGFDDPNRTKSDSTMLQLPCTKHRIIPFERDALPGR